MTPYGVALVKQFEGCRLVAYRDIVGVWTIGYGHTANVCDGQVITQAQADQLLVDELNAVEVNVLRLCLAGATAYQADALTSFAYNVGLGALGGSTVLRRHNAGDFIGAAAAFGLWNRAGGVPVLGLTKRRAAEAALYLRDSV